MSAAWEGLRCAQGQPYRTWKGLDFPGLSRTGVSRLCPGAGRAQYLEEVKQRHWGNALAVQWFGLGAFTAVAEVQSLVGCLGRQEALASDSV